MPATKHELQKMTPKAQTILDWMIENPGRSQKECARECGVTPVYVGLLWRSDTFRAEYDKRRRELVDPHLCGIQEKMELLADQAITELTSRVPQIEDPEVLAKVTDQALGRLGYSSQPKAAANGVGGNVYNVQNNYGPVMDRESLSKARERMHKFWAEPRENSEAEQSAGGGPETLEHGGAASASASAPAPSKTLTALLKGEPNDSNTSR